MFVLAHTHTFKAHAASCPADKTFWKDGLCTSVPHDKCTSSYTKPAEGIMVVCAMVDGNCVSTGPLCEASAAPAQPKWSSLQEIQALTSQPIGFDITSPSDFVIRGGMKDASWGGQDPQCKTSYIWDKNPVISKSGPVIGFKFKARAASDVKPGSGTEGGFYLTTLDPQADGFDKCKYDWNNPKQALVWAKRYKQGGRYASSNDKYSNYAQYFPSAGGECSTVACSKASSCLTTAQGPCANPSKDTLNLLPEDVEWSMRLTDGAVDLWWKNLKTNEAIKYHTISMDTTGPFRIISAGTCGDNHYTDFQYILA